MSLTVDFFREYFARPGVTQAEYAKLAQIDPSLLTKIMRGEVSISSKNIRRLLDGFRSKRDRLHFLSAYLRDQVPEEFADQVTIHTDRPDVLAESGVEDDEDVRLEIALIEGFNALPSDAYRRRVVRFIQQLRRDPELRKFFAMTMEYVDDGIATQQEAAATHHGIESILAGGASAVNPAAKSPTEKTPASHSGE